MHAAASMQALTTSLLDLPARHQGMPPNPSPNPPPWNCCLSLIPLPRHSMVIFSSAPDSSQPGQAAREGRWLVLEGLDMAPADLLASLVPLLESRQLPSQRHGASGPCHPDFRFIATVTSLPGEGPSNCCSLSPHVWSWHGIVARQLCPLSSAHYSKQVATALGSRVLLA